MMHDFYDGSSRQHKKTVLKAVRVVGEVAYVPLTQGYEAVIDADDAEIVGRYNWHAAPDKSGNVYAGTAYPHEDGKWRKVPLHRFLLRAPKGRPVDHEDGDGLNCRRYNLRVATPKENQGNKRMCKHNTSGFKGVRLAAWARGKNKYRANIVVSHKTTHLGYFATPQSAAKAYDAAAIEYFGEFAKTNAMLGLI